MRHVPNILGWVLAVGTIVTVSLYDPASSSKSPAAVIPAIPLCPSDCPYGQERGKMLDAAYPYAEMVSPPTCPYHTKS
jgi:hypothetical protein